MKRIKVNLKAYYTTVLGVYITIYSLVFSPEAPKLISVSTVMFTFTTRLQERQGHRCFCFPLMSEEYELNWDIIMRTVP